MLSSKRGDWEANPLLIPEFAVSVARRYWAVRLNHRIGTAPPPLAGPDATRQKRSVPNLPTRLPRFVR